MSTTVWSFNTFGRPFCPLLYKAPINWAAPIAKKLDETSDKYLDFIDEHVPLTRKNAKELLDTAQDIMKTPYTLTKKACDDYSSVLEERKGQIDGDHYGYIAAGKVRIGAICTVVSSRVDATSQWIMEFRNDVGTTSKQFTEKAKQAVGDAKETATATVKQVVGHAKDTAEGAMKAAEQKKDEFFKNAECQKEKSEKIAEQKKEEVLKKAENTTESVKINGGQ